mmetsp:Transcript_34132/g.85666  ORF Transcript_34132/g.85666 Transcript_34132/m.85666 type:complete len:227 (+) Transcript_34132:370-1050(+)
MLRDMTVHHSISCEAFGTETNGGSPNGRWEHVAILVWPHHLSRHNGIQCTDDLEGHNMLVVGVEAVNVQLVCFVQAEAVDVLCVRRGVKPGEGHRVDGEEAPLVHRCHADDLHTHLAGGNSPPRNVIQVAWTWRLEGGKVALRTPAGSHRDGEDLRLSYAASNPESIARGVWHEGRHHDARIAAADNNVCASTGRQHHGTHSQVGGGLEDAIARHQHHRAARRGGP